MDGPASQSIHSFVRMLPDATRSKAHVDYGGFFLLLPRGSPKPLPDMAALELTDIDLGTEVAPPQVESELKRFFSSDKAVTRASLMNFSIYSEDPAALKENTRLISDVTREHACRALLVTVDPGQAEFRVRSWVTAHCSTGRSGGKSVCSEQITFLVHGRSPSLISNIILARLDSDLPLVFWWQGHFSENFEPALYHWIDRLVIDSATWTDPRQEFAILRRAYLEKSSRFSVMDLAWTRVLQLRLALAACFDEQEALRELPLMQTVTIQHGSTQGMAAKMFAAWMASQADWKWVAQLPTGTSLFRSANGQEITFHFQAIDSPLCVTEVQLMSPQATITLTRDAQCGFIKGRCRLPGKTTEQLTPSTISTPVELVIERLRRGCNNKLYFGLLETVLKMLPA